MLQSRRLERDVSLYRERIMGDVALFGVADSATLLRSTDFIDPCNSPVVNSHVH
jgi:hypothetical protein